jgi:beta-galactosidase
MVRRDRNHPSIILWSIGNEIDYANDPFSDPVLGDRYRPRNPPATELVKCAAPLVAAVKELDHTRPVTAALATVNMSDAVGLPGLLDAVGYNYQETRYAEDHRQFPRRIIYGSENSHSASAWSAVRTNDYIAGQFLWTGVDYLGEADAWPNRASGPGLLDLCGFKKPLGWFRQSLWSDQPMVYLCVADAEARGPGGAETWNWPSNATVRVSCYANCPEVTLTLNGHSLGTKQRSEAVGGVLTWRIPYAPGTLRAVGRTNGQEACSFALQTAGPAARIELRPDTVQLRPDGRDIAQIEFRIVDEIGMRVPDAGNEVRFVLSGPARILGIGNGDLDNSEKCAGTDHRAYQGRGLVILQNDGHGGDITLQAIATGLAPANVYLHSP